MRIVLAGSGLLLGLVATMAVAAAPSGAGAPARASKARALGIARRHDAPAPPDSAAVLGLLAGVQNASCPLPGIATGGQIAAEHVAALRRAGFRTVLDLRGIEEARGFPEADSVRAAGLAYAAIPVTPATLDDSTFDAVRALMQDSRAFPILVHCRTGNRVGAMLLPWLVLDRGWPLERAETAAERAGMHAGEYRDRALAYVARRRAAR